MTWHESPQSLDDIPLHRDFPRWQLGLIPERDVQRTLLEFLGSNKNQLDAITEGDEEVEKNLGEFIVSLTNVISGAMERKSRGYPI